LVELLKILLQKIGHGTVLRIQDKKNGQENNFPAIYPVATRHYAIAASIFFFRSPLEATPTCLSTN
jgi:hypothetical protein